MALSIFQHWDDLTQRKPEEIPNKEFLKSYDPFMTNRIASMTNMFLPLAYEIDKFNLTKLDNYLFWSSVTPKAPYKSTYLKKKKCSKFDENRELIMEYFECGSIDFNVIAKILDESKIDEIKKMFGGKVGR
jgi:hypothetical protein